MSAEAMGWTFRHSPYKGAQLLLHLAIADVVNDAHGNEFWMAADELARKARVSRSTAFDTLAEMVEAGHLEVVERGGGRGKTTRYRFCQTVQKTVQPGGETVQSTPLNRPEIARELKELKEPKSLEKTVQFSDPNAECFDCHGTGVAYLVGIGRDGPCPCTKPYAPTERDEPASDPASSPPERL